LRMYEQKIESSSVSFYILYNAGGLLRQIILIRKLEHILIIIQCMSAVQSAIISDPMCRASTTADWQILTLHTFIRKRRKHPARIFFGNEERLVNTAAFKRLIADVQPTLIQIAVGINHISVNVFCSTMNNISFGVQVPSRNFLIE